MTDVSVAEVRFDGPDVQALLAEWNDELGFTPTGGSTVEAGDFASPDGVFLLAGSAGSPVGCGGLRCLAPTTGEIKRLYVKPAARANGIGRALLAALEEHATRFGMKELRLDTDGGEPAALALFRSAGYLPIADYNGNPYARYWFARRL